MFGLKLFEKAPTFDSVRIRRDAGGGRIELHVTKPQECDRLAAAINEARGGPTKELSAVWDRVTESHPDGRAAAVARDRAGTIARRLTAAREQLDEAEKSWRTAVAADEPTGELDALMAGLKGEIEPLNKKHAILIGEAARLEGQASLGVAQAVRDEFRVLVERADAELAAAQADLAAKCGPVLFKWLLALARRDCLTPQYLDSLLTAGPGRPFPSGTPVEPQSPAPVPAPVYARKYTVNGIVTLQGRSDKPIVYESGEVVDRSELEKQGAKLDVLVGTKALIPVQE